MRVVSTTLALWMSVAPVLADPYRLTVGDSVSVGVMGTAQTAQSTVDLDGSLRVPGLVQVEVAGLTLDEVQDTIEHALTDTAHLIDPEVMVSINSYAPIMISGDVRAPGSIDYQPNMSVDVALGIVGYGAQTAADETQVRLHYLAAEVALREANSDSRLAQSRVAVFANLLSDQSAPFFHDDPTLVAFHAALQQQLTSALEAWDQQLGASDGLIANLEARLVIQDQIIASRAQDVAIAQDLAGRQLGTNDAAVAASRNAMEAQARKLELETALSEAQVQRAALIREMTTTRDGFRLEWTERLLVATRDADAALVQVDAAQTRMNILSRTHTELNGAPAQSAFVFEIVRHAPAGSTRHEAHATSLLRPGDTLLVRRVFGNSEQLVTSYLD